MGSPDFPRPHRLARGRAWGRDRSRLDRRAEARLGLRPSEHRPGRPALLLQGAALAVIGIDNDGNVDLTHEGTQEDPRRPRHWYHAEPSAKCRHCQVEREVATARGRLSPLHDRAPETWPIVVGVPVEAVEAWILELLGLVDPARGLARAEDRDRGRYKQLLYGRPGAARVDVEGMALPVIASASQAHLAELRQRSRSFDLFAQQVGAVKALVHAEPAGDE